MVKKNSSSCFTGTAAILLLTVSMLLGAFAAENREAYASSWDTYRGSDENNAVINYETPISMDYTASAWTKKFGESANGMSGWNYAPNTPVIHNGRIVTTSYKEIMELDPDTGAVIRKGDISGTVNWGYTSITCAKLSDGTEVYFCPLAGGAIEAVNADPGNYSLKSMWVFRPKEKDSDGSYRWALTPERDKKEDEVPDDEDLTPDDTVYVGSAVHQSLCPILYSDGIVYTGYFAGDYEYYDYYIAIAAEKVTVGGRTYEPGELIWKYKSKGGFYWNGAIAVGDAVIVGTQDGVNNNDVTGVMSEIKADSHIISLSKETGEVITDIKLDDAGDICSGIVWDKEGTGRIYWSSCCGMIHSAEVSISTGAISDVKSAYLDGLDEEGKGIQSLTVNTPVVYNGKVYLGYKPKKGAYGYFAAYDAVTLENCFRAELKGYPKGSPLITTAYEKTEEGRPETGYLYAYISYYREPGGLQIIKFLPEPKQADDPYEATVTDLFGAIGYEQYSAGSIIADDKGQLYYKNDSNAIFAIKKSDKIELGQAEGLKVTVSGTKVTAKVNVAADANRYRVLYRLNNKGDFIPVSSESNRCTFSVKNSSVVTVRIRPEYVDAVKAVYGDYSDDKTIYASASVIKSLKAAKKAFTVKFDKHAQADGYEIQYSLKKSMASKKTLKKKGYSKVQYKVTKLKSRKKYYVRVRSYRTVSGKKCYGKWSAKEQVKTK